MVVPVVLLVAVVLALATLVAGAARQTAVWFAATGVAASAGAACHAKGVSVSATLTAMGLSETTARSAIRFSTGAMLTAPEIEHAIEIITDVEHHESIVATSDHDDLYACIDLGIDRATRQLTDHKSKLRDNKHNTSLGGKQQ